MELQDLPPQGATPWYEDYAKWQQQQHAELHEEEFIDVEGVEEGPLHPGQQQPNIFSRYAWEEWQSWHFTEDNDPAARSSTQNAPLDLTAKISPRQSYTPPPFSSSSCYSSPTSSSGGSSLPPTPTKRASAPPSSEFTAFGRRRWFTCDICHEVFNKKQLLIQHTLASHPGQGHYLRCTQCDYVCRSRPTLNKHVAKEHVPKTIRCQHCPETFSMPWSLNEHVKQCHKFYRCRHCQRAIGDLHSLSLHEEGRECLQCGAYFGCVWLFAKHWREHPVRVRCNFCTASFKMPSSLEHHMQAIHHSLR